MADDVLPMTPTEITVGDLALGNESMYNEDAGYLCTSSQIMASLIDSRKTRED